MRWLKKMKKYLKRAEQWESQDSLDSEITSLKEIFHAMKEDDLEIGNRVWKRLHPYLHPLEDPGTFASSLWAALATSGPRFALGGAFAFVITAGLFLTQAKTSSPIETVELNSLTILSEALAGSPAVDPIEIIQASNGDELLRFIAYESPQR